jgi:endonuclease-3 related protein
VPTPGRDPRAALLAEIYRRLRACFGPAGWWPGKTRFEICVGAILTQNTSWTNVERALRALRSRGMLSYAALRGLSASRLAPLIRGSGTFNVKARRLAAFVSFLGERYGGRVSAMGLERPALLRAHLLSVHGIGPETADAIALYAAGAPLFVVDAYTRRVFTRLGLLEGREGYDDVQRFFMECLPPDSRLFNDYHAQIVRLGKEFCRARPRCAECPLEDLCAKRGVLSSQTHTNDKPQRRRGTENKRSSPSPVRVAELEHFIRRAKRDPFARA